MEEDRPIQPCRRVDGTVRPPGSKSLTNRALIVAALAGGRSRIVSALISDDTKHMVRALRQVGIDVEVTETGPAFEVTGCDGRIPAAEADLHVGNSGTSMRFLCALLALGHGRFRIDGSPRMRERPIADLLDALGALGARAVSEAGTGCPPVVIEARGLAGGVATVSGAVSSQFLSALLMAAPYANGRVEIRIVGDLVSRPYVAMTVGVMRAFGAKVEQPTADRFLVDSTARSAGRRYVVEPDASNASYFLAAAAITGGRCRVEGVGTDSIQGDADFAGVLQQMGATVRRGPDWTEVAGGRLAGIDTDLNTMPDMVLTLAAIAPFADGPTTIRNVANLRVKETDRLSALATELRRIGQHVEERADGLTIAPAPIRPATIETYDDHRMAMSFALVGLRAPGLVILDPGCVAKTFPDFFDTLGRLCR